MSIEFIKPLELLNSEDLIKICAPMVRYSKLPFRALVRKYKCDLAYTPMIISSSFNQSVKARNNEFTTNSGDRPLIVQFAANNATDLATAAELIYSYSDGVDLNCGCPQKWAMSEGYGACLIKKPELLRDMVLQTRNKIPDNDFTVSIKIRIHDDIKETVELCRKIENAGVSFIAVHGRTIEQRKEPVNVNAIKTIVDSVRIPVIANGDIDNLENAQTIRETTGVKGVMAARGLLENPAMFSGENLTPYSCVKDWIAIGTSLGVHFSCFHHHLIYMLQNILTKSERRVFNTLSSTSAILDYLDNYYFEND